MIEHLNTPTCMIGERNAGIYNVPVYQGPGIFIPLWPWLQKFLLWLKIPGVV
jgi:hypothetical protein